MTRRFAILAACVAAVMVGCGGGESDEEQVRAAISTYLDALADGDGDRACEQLTGEQVRAVVTLAIEQLPELGATSCPNAIQGMGDMLGADERSALQGAEPFHVGIDGETATAFVRGGMQIEMRLVDGRWLIASGIGSP